MLIFDKQSADILNQGLGDAAIANDQLIPILA